MTNSDDAAAGERAPAAPLREVQYEISREFVPVLERLGVSLLVSTYQAGKLVVVGTEQGKLALGFYNFEQPMGLALSGEALAVGTRNQVWLLAREAELAPQLHRGLAYDDCYLARRAHFTGQIHVHELAWGGADGRELWLVNTLFSCLATLDDRHSFVPRWQPPFISGLAAEDRCHLNGLAMDGGRPRFVTAMSETDAPQSWRPTKVTSGCILDVPSGQTVARGLAMPHSPRLAGGRLWVLDSGRGNLSVVDPASGRIEVVDQVPGYTRGLAIQAGFAFVGMSRIRETSTFGGVPIAEQRDLLRCGVAVIDLRRGQAVAYLEFKTGIEEVFDVQVVPQSRLPFVSGPSPTEDDEQAVWMVPRGGAKAISAGVGAQEQVDRAALTRPPPAATLSRWEREGGTADEWNEQGGRLMEQGRYDEAEAAYRRAIEIQPTCGAAWANLAFLTADRGDAEEGRRLYDEAYRHQPSPQLAIVRGTVLPPIYRDEEHIRAARARFTAEVDKLLADGVRMDPARTTTPSYFFLAYQGENDRDLMAKLAQLAPTPPGETVAPKRRPRSERIRIGFLSRYLCDHTIGQLNVGLLEQLDRQRFEVVVLAAGAADDAVTRRIREAVDRYVALPPAVPAALQAVREQSLDVLHYPDIGMAPFTYGLAHFRLAPVQTTTWGHPVTSGLPTIDYFLSCQHGEPDAADGHYTERLIRLSRLNVCLARPQRRGPPRRREHFRLAESEQVYVCPQTPFKFHPRFDAALAGILRGDPRGVVVTIAAKYPQWQAQLVERWRRTMPDVAERIRFVPQLPRHDFLELLACADVMLDPFPFGGGHTSYEALSLGLPVVTLPGDLLRGRLTYAMYRQLDYTPWIAADREHYVRLALELGADPVARRAARQGILDRCDALYDDRAIVRELEAFFVRAVSE